MKKRHLIAVLMTTLTLTFLSGCADKDSDTDLTQNQTAETEETTSTSEDESDENTDSEPAHKKDLFNSMNTVDLDGNAVDTSLFSQNKMTVVNVWNTGCTPCIREVPILDKLNTELASENISIKGLIYEYSPGLSDKGRNDVEEILADAGATYQHLLASEEMLNSPTLKQLTAFPTTYFVDPQGEIFASTVGANDYEGWKDIISQALDLLENNE